MMAILIVLLDEKGSKASPMNNITKDLPDSLSQVSLAGILPKS